MNVLFLDQFSEPGGAQQCLVDLLPAVIARGWKAIVAAPGDGWLAERAVAAGAKFHRVRCGPFHSGRKSLADVLRFLHQAPGLAREIASLPADLIYVNGPRLLPAVPRGRPVIFHCHSFLGNRHTAWLAGGSIRRTNATVIAACRFVLEPLGRFATHAHVVYNGVAEMTPHQRSAGGPLADARGSEQSYSSEQGHGPQLSHGLEQGHSSEQSHSSEQGRVSEQGRGSEQSYGSGQGHSSEQGRRSEQSYGSEQSQDRKGGASPEFRIGMIGRIAPQKGQAELLHAARHLRDCRITICGAPLFGEARYSDELRALAQGLPVEFLDWQDDPGQVLARLDLLLVPSTVPEATPRVIVEAFAAGVPVLASACGGIPELIERDRTGFLIESLAPEALARQIRDLAAQPELRDFVAANGRQAWREHYTLAEYQRRILSIMATAGASARR